MARLMILALKRTIKKHPYISCGMLAVVWASFFTTYIFPMYDGNSLYMEAHSQGREDDVNIRTLKTDLQNQKNKTYVTKQEYKTPYRDDMEVKIVSGSSKDEEKVFIKTQKSKSKHTAESVNRNTEATVVTEAKTTANSKLKSGSSKLTGINSYSCPFPNADPFDEAIMRYIRKYPPLDCSWGMPSLAFVDGNFLRINKTKTKNTVGYFDFCRTSPLLLSDENDLNLQNLIWSDNFVEFIQVPSDIENFVLHCIRGDEIIAETYISRIIEKPEVEKRSEDLYKRHLTKNSPAETLSVLFVGIDGMSKHNLIRTMPKTRNFLLQKLNAKELHKFNKVDDNTFANVVVLLSGHTSKLLKSFENWDIERDYFDYINDIFLWHDYQQAGYRTAAMFDITGGTAFHYQKMGWRNPPFDYYNRAVPLRMNGESKKESDNCIGELREVSFLLDYWFQLTARYNNTKTKPYFAYSFFTHLSHDDQNEASKGDEMYLEFFQEIYERNVLNNTLLIFFSDHGLRFGQMRETYNGVIESKTPFLFFMFPPWFEKKYPEEMSTFQINQNRLTSFHDIHATLKDLLNFRGKNKETNRQTPGISLFQEIPDNRTCADANITPEFCVCMELSNRKISKRLKYKLGRELLIRVKQRVRDHRDKCAELKLKKVRRIRELQTAEPKHSMSHYQVVIETSPGGGHFEALLSYDKSRTRSRANVNGDITRLNLYRGQDTCVVSLALKPYCFCKE